MLRARAKARERRLKGSWAAGPVCDGGGGGFRSQRKDVYEDVANATYYLLGPGDGHRSESSTVTSTALTHLLSQTYPTTQPCTQTVLHAL